MKKKLISKEVASEKYGIITTGASGYQCKYYLLENGNVVDNYGSIRFYARNELDLDLATDEQIDDEFEEYICERLSDEQFWDWVKGWFDVEEIIDIATHWDTDEKKSDLEEFYKLKIK